MLLKLSKFLDKLSFKLKRLSLYYELVHHIKTGKDYFKPVYRYTRGIGKTYTLLQLAHKYKCPIVVQREQTKDYLYHMSMKNFNKPVKVITANEIRPGKTKVDLVLLEEGIERRILSDVQYICKQAVGYITAD